MKLFLLFSAILFAGIGNAQLIITSSNNAQALAQKLVGDGVTISNVTLTGDSVATGFFNNISGTQIGLDSGIVLTNGRAKTNPAETFDGVGLDGDGINPANNDFTSHANYAHTISTQDTDLANLLNITPDETNDASVLEFDFVPVGDSIKFRYVFSSEEYPEFACPFGGGTLYNDAFAFFIQGPGFPVKTNIALVPGTTDPVTIANINDQGCALYPQYYVFNENNVYFTHNGHTVILTAVARVQPCQTYHLKLVIADIADQAYDSGVFLEAKSLTSNIVSLTNNTQTDINNNSYIVEGCLSGSFTIKRPYLQTYPLTIGLTYGGTAVNGVDVQMLPSTVVIPANDTMVTVNVIPVIDLLPEGIEFVKVYASAGCGSLLPIDSTVFQIRDFDTLGLVPQDSFICKNSSIQLQAWSGNTAYQWTAIPGLNNYNISNPVATPLINDVTYICTATIGTCNSRDSLRLRWKELEFNSLVNVNCKDAATGKIIVSGGSEWSPAVQYWINTSAPQPGGTFNNLITGAYMVHVRDAVGCMDSLPVTIIQAFPDLVITDTLIQTASCTSNTDGRITITASGGKVPYQYSLNGVTFQNSNFFNVGAGTYSIYVKDANGCRAEMHQIIVPFINTVTLSTGTNPVICESKSAILPASTNANSVKWTVAPPGLISTLNNSLMLNPSANPVVTTKYYIVATTGICNRKDSVTVIVNPAPVPDAGENITVCSGGQTRLQGSGGVDYYWHPGTYLSNQYIINPFVNNALTTTYFLDVTDSNGCKSLKSDDVLVTVPPPAKLFAGNDTIVAVKQPLQLLATDINHTGFTNYSWEPSQDLNNSFIRNPVAILTDAFTQFIVTASTAANCIGKDTVNVKTYYGPEIYVPNSFTPNSDGTNDILKALPVGIKSFSYFNIYNRYGQMVFSTTDPNKGWDGTLRGSPQNFGSFVWIAAGIDYKGRLVQRKGTTTIIQ